MLHEIMQGRYDCHQLFLGSKQYEVIAIPDVILDAKLLLDKCIELIEVHISQPLARIVSYGHVALTANTAYNVTQEINDIFVLNLLLDDAHKGVVVYAWIKLGYIAF